MANIEQLTDVMDHAYAAKSELFKIAEANGKPVQMVLHWTAGRYTQVHSSYHINIDGDGDVHITCSNFAERLPHNYCKNAASIGITLCCAYNASPHDLGDFPPTEEQIESMAQVIAVISEALGIEIDIEHCPSHSESAMNYDYEIYFPDYTGFPNNVYGAQANCERWDLQRLRMTDDWILDEEDPMTGPNQIRSLARAFRKKYYGH